MALLWPKQLLIECIWMDTSGLERAIVSKFGIHVEYVWSYGSAKLCICVSVCMSVVMILVKWYT